MHLPAPIVFWKQSVSIKTAVYCYREYDIYIKMCSFSNYGSFNYTIATWEFNTPAETGLMGSRVMLCSRYFTQVCQTCQASMSRVSNISKFLQNAVLNLKLSIVLLMYIQTVVHMKQIEFVQKSTLEPYYSYSRLHFCSNVRGQ